LPAASRNPFQEVILNAGIFQKEDFLGHRKTASPFWMTIVFYIDLIVPGLAPPTARLSGISGQIGKLEHIGIPRAQREGVSQFGENDRPGSAEDGLTEDR
jgi:hypothetical protein